METVTTASDLMRDIRISKIKNDANIRIELMDAISAWGYGTVAQLVVLKDTRESTTVGFLRLDDPTLHPRVVAERNRTIFRGLELRLEINRQTPPPDRLQQYEERLKETRVQTTPKGSTSTSTATQTDPMKYAIQCGYCKGQCSVDDYEAHADACIGRNSVLLGVAAAECPICKPIRSRSCKQVMVTACGHMFCLNCLKQWRQSENNNAKNCPLCRSTLKYEPKSFKP